MTVKFKNFRDWLSYLDDTKRLLVTKPGVDLRFGVMRYIERFEGKQACFFPSPSGHPVPVAGGTLAQRQWAAEAMGVSTDKLLSHYKQALTNPTPWEVVKQEQAPVHEVIHDSEIDIKKLLPVVTHHEKDAGPYITCGLVSAINPKTGKQNLSIHRMQVHAPDKIGILILPRDLHAYYLAAEAENKPLPVTITIGHQPVVELASQAIAPRDQCELEIAGSLQSAPLRVVKSYTNDVYVPADAEFSIEGEIIPRKRSLEGPFGEFPGYYSGAGVLPYIQIKCITHRKNPIYKTNNPAGAENLVLGGIPRESSLLARIQLNFPNVLDCRLTPGGLAKFHIAIKMKKRQYGEAKNVIACAFGCHYDIKQVIVVDEDIDLNDSESIEWAVATRFQADRDLVILDRALGSKLDPSTDERGLGSKIGLDATAYLGDDERFYVSKVPLSDHDLSDEIADSSSSFRNYTNKN